MSGFFRSTVEDVSVASREITEAIGTVQHDEELSFISHLHQVLILCSGRNAETLRAVRDHWLYSETIHQALILVEDRDRLSAELARVTEPIGALLFLLGNRL